MPLQDTDPTPSFGGFGLTGPLPEQQRKLSTEDESGVVELITDPRELFEHLGGHCNEAVTALWSLTETLAE